ncbi:MAG: hypothetical protein ACLTKI_04730 [Lachnospiraceae bacterium]
MKRWKTARSLHELVDVPENLKGFVQNYKINVVEVAFLSEETIAKFTSDFRIVAEYFRSKRLGNPNEIMYYNDKVWVHVAELIEFFKTFTTDSRFEKFKAHILDKAEKGEVRMCEMLDFFENKGMEKGRYHSLDKLMEATKMSLEEAMSVLDFSPKEKTGYLEQQKSE